MVRWFITVFLMLLPLSLLACSSSKPYGEVVTDLGQGPSLQLSGYHRTIPAALAGSHGDRVWFGRVEISMAPKPALVSNGERWVFRTYHGGALKGQGTMDIYVDADAISFEPKPGVSVKVKGFLHYGEDGRMTVKAFTVEQICFWDTKDCR